MKKIFSFLLLVSSSLLIPHAMVKNRRFGPDANYGTHITPLLVTLLNTDGPVLELGCGDFSTPWMHEICKVQDRYLLSAESSKTWIPFFLDLQSPMHRIELVPNWHTIGNERQWSVVFIDHAPGKRRLTDIKRLRSKTKIFVAHDTQLPLYEDIFSTFKYTYTYERYQVRTTVASDTIDVRAFFDKPTGQQMMKNRRFGPNANYGTHITPLITAIINTEGPVLELGCGDFSTPLAHAICKVQNRSLLSVETSQNRMNYFLDLANNFHEFQYLPVYEECESQENMIGGRPVLWDQIGNDEHYGVVFVNHTPNERRGIDIQRLRNNTDVFVVHDTQEPTYGLEPILKTFKYRYDYKRYAVRTTLVSDTIDVASFFQD